MSTTDLCNCEQALELTTALRDIVQKAEEWFDFQEEVNGARYQDGIPGELMDATERAAAVLAKYDEAAIERFRCKHCGLPGGH